MAIRNILQREELALTRPSRTVAEFDDRLRTLLDDMTETLEKAGGVGLAAPQVGILRRAALVQETNTEEGEEYFIELINPEIILSVGEQNGAEGCLSVPGLYGYVTRPENVTVRAQNRFGEFFEVTGTGLTARALCHEVDHLNGLLFTRLTDRLLTPEELDELEAKQNKGKHKSKGKSRSREKTLG